MSLCYPLTPSQLRRAHDLDWQCCSRIFNLPLRVCSSVEPDNVKSVISKDKFNEFMQNIEKNWEKWTNTFQVFVDDTELHKGWRLRIHPTYPLPKVYIPERDTQVQIGWAAACPENGPSSHLYNRSPCMHNGYLGGIISLSNQGPSKIIVGRDKDGPKTWKVYISKVNLAPNEEVLWRYGGAALREDWSLMCCAEIEVHSVPRGPRLAVSHTAFPKAKTTCLLCGYDLTSKSDKRETPSNFKGHYARCHLTYFSSGEPLDWDEAMYELEIFHKIIAGLKSKKYAVRFCNASGIESMNGSQKDKFEGFKKTYNMFRAVDILLLKGDKVPKVLDDLKPEPITTWSADVKQMHKKSSFTYAKAQVEKEEIDKMAEVRMYDIVHHSF